MEDPQKYDDYRWSELIPPHTALTFAAVWDPNEGMITFSGAHLLDSEASSSRLPPACAVNDAPRDACDGQSQVLTIDLLVSAFAGSAPDTAALAMEQEYLDAQADADSYLPQWLGVPPGMGMALHSPAFASSVALASFPQQTQTEQRTMVKACLERARVAIEGRQARPKHPLIQIETATAASSDESVTDEGYCEARRVQMENARAAPILVNLNLKSKFSVTTTSTNNYVEVDFPSMTEDHTPSCSSWSTLHNSLPGADHAFFFAPPCTRPRRLRKARSESPTSPVTPADPAEVLARAHYNHVTPREPPSACSSPTLLERRNSIARARRVLTRLGRCGKHEDEAGWVCVEITHKVTQRIVQDRDVVVG